MHHPTRLGAGRVDLPQFLDADGIALWIAAFVELVFRDELFAQMAARAFGKDGVFGMQLHAELEAVVRQAVLANAKVAGGDTLYRR
ncbi:hypothetical protein Y695_00576 [Hydrogenophaga sp. T4]|nr:hypothetical protein Y695_00576 [Hydrogenophaga sp. T4]